MVVVASNICPLPCNSKLCYATRALLLLLPQHSVCVVIRVWVCSRTKARIYPSPSLSTAKPSGLLGLLSRPVPQRKLFRSSSRNHANSTHLCCGLRKEFVKRGSQNKC